MVIVDFDYNEMHPRGQANWVPTSRDVLSLARFSGLQQCTIHQRQDSFPRDHYHHCKTVGGSSLSTRSNFRDCHRRMHITLHCIALQRIVLRNKGAAPITSYRLGWVVVFADPKKPAEVHVGNSAALYQVIG